MWNSSQNRVFKKYVLDKKRLNYYTFYAKAELNKNNWPPPPPNKTTKTKTNLNLKIFITRNIKNNFGYQRTLTLTIKNDYTIHLILITVSYRTLLFLNYFSSDPIFFKICWYSPGVMCSTQRHRYQIEQIVFADNEALSHHFVPGSSYLT